MSHFDLAIYLGLFLITVTFIWLAYATTKDSESATDEYDIPTYKRKLNTEQQNKLMADLQEYKPTVQ